MATLYEYYNTGSDQAFNFYDTIWSGQTFTPSTAHKITSVKLKLFRSGSPGTITVGIRATDGGHPTGEDLCSGTTDGDTLTADSGGEWREITLGAGYNLAADTKYAIVVRALSGDTNNRGWWRCDQTSPTYTDGCLEYSSNSGSSWQSYTDYDNMFEDWGEAIAEGTTVTPGTLSLTLTEYVPILKEVTTPTTLSLTLTEYAPILKEVLTPTTLSLTTTTYVPVLKEVTTPSTLSLTTTGYAPILKEVLTPSTLSLSTMGYAPILAEALTPTTLSLSLTGYIPVLNSSIAIGLLELVLTGYAPTLGEEAPFRHAWGIIFG